MKFIPFVHHSCLHVMSTQDPSHTKSPLTIPEIRSLITQYLTVHDLTRCILVCRAWKEWYIPLIWRDIRFSRRGPCPNVLQYKEHVRKMAIGTLYEDESLLTTFPNVESIMLSFMNYDEEALVNKFLLLNPSVKDLELGSTYVYANVLSAMPNLRRLDDFSERFDLVVGDKEFWDICQRLERLICLQSNLLGLPKDMDFPNMMHLDIACFRTSKEDNLIDFARQCPSLEYLRLPAGAYPARPMVQEFTNAAMAGCWTRLNRLRLDKLDISEEQLAQVLGCMDPCIGWNVVAPEFGPQSFQVLRPEDHFRRIQELYLHRSPTSQARWSRRSCRLV
ncbi:hypothetical protein B0O80DRAFT_508128 [Mortierella sp. GBAus27b]|nr:hypothetical protein B0O80DRAFT_508128 [Mortierella sp. GBAus27b]